VGTLVYSTGGIVSLFAWLLWGDFAWQMRDRSVGPVVQLFLKNFGATDTMVALMMTTLPGVLGLIIGPMVSYHSDRHRGRWGRRIPFLLIPAPFVTLAMVGFAYSPTLGHLVHEALGVASPGYERCVLLLFSAFWAVFELAVIIAGPVFGGLINDVVPTVLIGRFYGLFRAVSLGCGIVFNWWLLGSAEKWYFWLFIVVGLIYGAGVVLMCFRVKEGSYPPPPPVELRERWMLPLIPPGLQLYFRECFSQRYYLLLFTANTLVWAAFIPVNTFGLFFAKSVNFSLATYGKLLAVAYVGSFLLAFPLGWLADRFHPLRVGLVSMVLYAVLVWWGAFYIGSPATFAIGHIGCALLSGSWMTGTASIGQRLLPRSKFAQYGSAMGIFTQLGCIWVAPAVGWVLDRTANAPYGTYQFRWIWIDPNAHQVRDLMQHHYRYAYLGGAILMTAAIAAWLVLWLQFQARGGLRGYVAPEPEPKVGSVMGE
jgi:MFS family permease